MYIKYPHSLRRNLKVLAIGAACMSTALLLGIQSAGEVQPISLIEAGGPQLSGDVTGDGVVDLNDVTRILEIAQGYAQVTADELKADPNGDGVITVDDALRILSVLSLR